MPMSSLALAETSCSSPAPAREQESLTRAFVSFTQAASSLEHSYAQLQSEIGRLRAELQQANAELEEQRQSARRLQALAEVSSLLAHEIRNPLGSMELFASLLAESNLPEPQNAWMGHIAAGLRTLAATVNNVLHLHSDMAVELVPTDAGDLLHWALEFLTPLAQQAGVRLKLRNEVVGMRILADAHRLQQVILNLVLNALQVLPAGGQVLLAGRRVAQLGEDWAELEITDNGQGIASEHLERIYDSGFTTKSGGAGLGLTVCKKLVEQHGGEIYVSSIVGQGTTFLLRFRGAPA